VLGEDFLEGEEASCVVDENLEKTVQSFFCQEKKLERGEVGTLPAPQTSIR